MFRKSNETTRRPTFRIAEEAPSEVHYRIYLYICSIGTVLELWRPLALVEVLAAQVYRLAASVLASSSFTSRTIWRNVPRNALLSLV
jgi:hypothetical protein